MEKNNNASSLPDTKQLFFNVAVVETLSTVKEASSIESEKMQHIKQKKSSNTEVADQKTNILGKSTNRSSSKGISRTNTRSGTGNILGEKYQGPIKKASNINILAFNNQKNGSAAKIKKHILKRQKINYVLQMKDKAGFGKKGVDKVISISRQMIQLLTKEVGKIFALSAAACLPCFICFISVVMIVTVASASSAAFSESDEERENSISYADCIAYNQGDARWSSLPVGGSSSFGSSGCCLTCIATCIASWGYPDVTPAIVWRYAKNMNGYDNTALGQNVIRNMIPSYGLNLQVLTNVKDDFEQIETVLSDGKYVIVFVDNNNGDPGYFYDKDTGTKTKKFTSRTHFFVLIGREGEYVVCMDPNGGEIRYTTPDELKKAFHCMDYANGAGYGYEAFVVWNAAMLPEGVSKIEE